MSLERKTRTVTVTVLVQFTVWTLPKHPPPAAPATPSLGALTWPSEKAEEEEEQQQLPGEAINIFQLFA